MFELSFFTTCINVYLVRVELVLYFLKFALQIVVFDFELIDHRIGLLYNVKERYLDRR